MSSAHWKAAIKKIIPEPARLALRRVVMGSLYAGRRYRCPMCHSRLRKFRPMGVDLPVIDEQAIVGAGRREALCPVCGSGDRERLVYLFLVNRLGIGSRPLRILHVAPEPALARFLTGLRAVDYLTSDISGREVMRRMDITSIPYPDGEFGGIICNHVLEHIIDDRLAMRELFRVLNPGGWAILQVPISKHLAATLEDAGVTTESDRERVFGQKDHVRIYAADYPDRLKSMGFKVEAFQWWTAGEGFGGSANPFGLLRQETLYFAIRPE